MYFTAPPWHQGMPAIRWAGNGQVKHSRPLMYFEQKDSSLVLSAELFSHPVALATRVPCSVGPKCKSLNSRLTFKEGKIQALIDHLTWLSHLLLSDFHLCIQQTFLESLLCISDMLFLLSLVGRQGGGWGIGGG